MLPQGQVEGYAAFSEQLLQDYNVHAAAVMGRTPAAPAGPMRPMSSKAAAAAAAAGQAGAEVASEMNDEERQRFRQQTGRVWGCTPAEFCRDDLCQGRLFGEVLMVLQTAEGIQGA